MEVGKIAHSTLLLIEVTSAMFSPIGRSPIEVE